MKIIFFGLGSIGKKHLKLLLKHFDAEIYIFRHRQSEKNEFGLPEIYDLKEIKKIKPNAAFIATPTDKHIEYALFCAKEGISLFLEKPLSHNGSHVGELLRIVDENNIPTYIAYCLRHHPVIKWLKNYVDNNHKDILHVRVSCTSNLTTWRQGNHLKHYSAFSARGGDISFELSHEIDYICYLLGIPDSIKSNSARVSDVTVDAKDFADILFRFDDVYASLHINFYSQRKERKIIIETAAKTIVSDLLTNEIEIIESKKSSKINFEMEPDEIYLHQLQYFFNNLECNNLNMMNNLKEALPIFNTILKAGAGME